MQTDHEGLARRVEALADRAGINLARPMVWEACDAAICDEEHGFCLGNMASEIFPSDIDEANAELVALLVNNLSTILTALTADNARGEALATAVQNVLPVGNDKHPDNKVVAFYLTAGELRALRTLAGAAK